MAELAAQVAHSRSRITHTIARLERAGLVTRGQCSEDGRGVCAVLTAHGYDTLRAAAHTHVRGVRDYLVDIAGDEEFGVIGRVLERVRSHLGGAEFSSGALLAAPPAVRHRNRARGVLIDTFDLGFHVVGDIALHT